MIHVNGKDYLFAKCTGYVASHRGLGFCLKVVVASSSGRANGPISCIPPIVFVSDVCPLIILHTYSIPPLHIVTTLPSHPHVIYVPAPQTWRAIDLYRCIHIP